MELSEQAISEAKRRLARKMGSDKASLLLNRLGENRQFINAIETPTGMEIISLVVSMLEDMVDKILKPGYTESQWNELYPEYVNLQAGLKFHGKVLNKFNTYDKDREQFNKVSGDLK